MAVAVRVSANFERNLESIRCFFLEHGAQQGFEGLLDLIFETVVPNLEQFPFMGRDLLDVPPGSVEARRLLDGLSGLMPEGASLREYIGGDYLVLYLVAEDAITLLSVKHHRQLSFDLNGLYAT